MGVRNLMIALCDCGRMVLLVNTELGFDALDRPLKVNKEGFYAPHLCFPAPPEEGERK